MDQLIHSDGYYHFDRYVDGKLKAEGVAVLAEGKTFEQALQAAARIASRGPHGELPVLFLKRASE